MSFSKEVLFHINNKEYGFPTGTTFSEIIETIKKIAGDDMDSFEFLNEKRNIS